MILVTVFFLPCCLWGLTLSSARVLGWRLPSIARFSLHLAWILTWIPRHELVVDLQCYSNDLPKLFLLLHLLCLCFGASMHHKTSGPPPSNYLPRPFRRTCDDSSDAFLIDFHFPARVPVFYWLIFFPLSCPNLDISFLWFLQDTFLLVITPDTKLRPALNWLGHAVSFLRWVYTFTRSHHQMIWKLLMIIYMFLRLKHLGGFSEWGNLVWISGAFWLTPVTVSMWGSCFLLIWILEWFHNRTQVNASSDFLPSSLYMQVFSHVGLHYYAVTTLKYYIYCRLLFGVTRCFFLFYLCSRTFLPSKVVSVMQCLNNRFNMCCQSARYAVK